jgi:thiosulfate reductase cytochrome b subunit
MDSKDFSKFFWDIVKYVLSAGIITTFLGEFEKPRMVYFMGAIIVVLFATLGTYFYKLSKNK